MKRLFTVFVSSVLIVGALAGCSTKKEEAPAPAANQADETNKEEKELEKIIVGASPSPHAEILNSAKDILAEQGYELVVKEYTDYIQPNVALENGDLDANYFQHLPYLENFNKENDTHLAAVADMHFEPIAIYAGKTKSLDDLQDGAQIAVPNDTTNEARALLLLAEQGLIKVNEDAGLEATIKDITENTRNFKFIEAEAAQLPRSLPDVDIAVINGNYALEAGLNASEDALAKEGAESLAAETYPNVVVVKEGNEENDKTKALVEALHSETVRSFIEETYKGAVVPLF